VHEPTMTADEAYRKVLRATKSGPHHTSSQAPHHHPRASSSEDSSLLQEAATTHHEQHEAHHPTHVDLHHAKDLSVDELARLANQHIKAGNNAVRNLEDFQQQVAKKDGLEYDPHNMLHEPIVHHHQHRTNTASLLETASEVKHGKHHPAEIPEVLIEEAAKREKENAEDGIEELIAKANGAINKNKKLADDTLAYKAKIRSIQKEFESLAKSVPEDVETLRREQALIAKTQKQTAVHHEAAPVSNDELSFLEDAATTLEHKGSTSRHLKAKLEKKHRRKHGHS